MTAELITVYCLVPATLGLILAIVIILKGIILNLNIITKIVLAEKVLVTKEEYARVRAEREQDD